MRARTKSRGNRSRLALWMPFPHHACDGAPRRGQTPWRPYDASAPVAHGCVDAHAGRSPQDKRPASYRALRYHVRREPDHRMLRCDRDRGLCETAVMSMIWEAHLLRPRSPGPVLRLGFRSTTHAMAGKFRSLRRALRSHVRPCLRATWHEKRDRDVDAKATLRAKPDQPEPR